MRSRRKFVPLIVIFFCSERWERASKLGLDPPESVQQILETLAGDTSKGDKYEKCIREGRI